MDFRAFETKVQLPMMTLYKSLILPIIKYSSYVWMPGTLRDIREHGGYEELLLRQNYFGLKLVSAYNYWENLELFKIYPLE